MAEAAEAPDAVMANGEPEQPAEAPPNPLATKLTSCWNAVREKPEDFAAWAALVTAAERLDEPEQLKSAYDSLLAQWPLCYGYWKKYVEALTRHGQAEEALQVLARGASSVPYSVPFWQYYASHLQTQGASPDAVRSVFERGVAYCATDYQATPLWDSYVSFERVQGTPAAVAALYVRALQCPLEGLDRLEASLRQHADQHLVSELLSGEQIAALRSSLESSEAAAAKQPAGAAGAAGAAAAAVGGAGVQDEAGEPVCKPEMAPLEAVQDVQMVDVTAEVKSDAPAPDATAPDVAAPGAPDAAAADAAAPDAAAGAASAAAQNGPSADEAKASASAEGAAAEGAGAAADGAGAAATAPAAEDGGLEAAAALVSDDAVKHAWLSQCAAAAGATRSQLEATRRFELGIKRPYFHPKALDPAQLRNWHSYLDWAESEATAAREQGRLGALQQSGGGGGDGGSAAAAVATAIYERCLVPCALYPEYWARYLRWLEGRGDGGREDGQDAAPAALQRALALCGRHPETHLMAARFMERRGDAAEARAAFQKLLSEVAPGLLEAVSATANFERRQGDRAAACGVFETAIAEERSRMASSSSGGDGGGDGGGAADGADGPAANGGGGAAAEGGGDQEGAGSSTKGSSSTRLGPLGLLYAHFLRHNYDDVDTARSVLSDCLEAVPGCRALWEGAMFFESTVPGPDRASRVEALAERALAGPGGEGAGGEGTRQSEGRARLLSEEDREAISQRAVDLADACGDAAALAGAESRHARLFPVPPDRRGGAGTGAAGRRRSPGEAAAAAGAAAAAPGAGPVVGKRMPGQEHAYSMDPAAAAAAAGYYPDPSMYGGGYPAPPPMHHHHHHALHHGHHHHQGYGGGYGGYGGYGGPPGYY